MERRVVRRSQAFFSAPDGTRLFRRAWMPPMAQRALAVVHGFAEHSGRYDHVGAWFAAREFAVHAYDQRGHGRSDGTRGHVESFSHLLDDLESFLDVVRREHPELPLVLLGHSMGGLVTTALLAERKPDLLGAVVTGPPLELGRGVSRTKLRFARLLRGVAPTLRLRAGIDSSDLSRDAEVVKAYDDDPLVFRRASASLAAELLDTVARTAGAGVHVHVPMLLLHGEADRLCPPRGTRNFHGLLRGAGHRLRVYPKLRHEILNEPEQEQVFEDVLAWVQEREAES
ncbi:MAG: alpha/beta hydrolase [Proteobacteria bacterium]|nr:MAG: alpha/beta hydrolase [Pseudomonadota bacterium]